MLAALVIALSSSPPSPWQDHTQPVAARVESLIGLLTLDEKASLLGSASAAVPRLGLPSYNWGRECERGDVSGPAGTAYPTGLALGASFDVRMLHKVAAATALEVRGNINAAAAAAAAPVSGGSCFGPVSNLVRDSRWGRTAEMLTGEDPLLGRVLSRAFTWGMMGRPPWARQADPAGRYRMLITIAKHLNTYAGPEGWGYTFGPHAVRFNFEARLTEREWREFFLPAYVRSLLATH
jgi:beta-glucosidase